MPSDPNKTVNQRIHHSQNASFTHKKALTWHSEVPGSKYKIGKNSINPPSIRFWWNWKVKNTLKLNYLFRPLTFFSLMFKSPRHKLKNGQDINKFVLKMFVVCPLIFGFIGFGWQMMLIFFTWDFYNIIVINLKAPSSLK